MKLIWKYGEEAICPSCGHNNACIWYHKDETNPDWLNGGIFKCRDCFKKWIVTGERVKTGKDDLLGRPIVEAECKEVP